MKQVHFLMGYVIWDLGPSTPSLGNIPFIILGSGISCNIYSLTDKDP